MKPPFILSKSISSLLLLGSMGAVNVHAQSETRTWDGGGVGGTELGEPVNWSGDLLPRPEFGDIALWDGTVAGPLNLQYSNNAFAGVAGNAGINLVLSSTQTAAVNLDSGANISSFRLNNITIEAGAGAFSLGNGAGAFNLTLGGLAGETHTWMNHSSNVAVIASDVTTALGGGGAHNLVLGGAGGWTFNNAIGQGNGTLTLVKNGAGILTLTGANTYTGGLVLNAGTLLVNHAGALGNTAAGAFVINGGVIDNTSGAAISTTTAKAQNWNGDFTFTGTNNLSFSGGVATLGGAGNKRTVNVNSGALTTGSIIGIGYGLTKTGDGTLALGSGVSRISGDVEVAAGTIQIGAQDLVVGGKLTGPGTIENGSGTVRWLYAQGNGDSNFSGTLRDGGSAGLGLYKGGGGTLTLTGATTYTHQTTIGGGTLEFGSAGAAGSARTVSTIGGTGLLFDRGDGAVKASSNGAGTNSLTFGARVARTAGATGNFIISGGTNGDTNRINLTAAAGFLNHGLFFNGENYAWMDGANTFVRALNYDGVEGVTSGPAVTLVSAAHQQITGGISAQESATFTTLKIDGNHALTLNTGAVLTTNGILKTGNVAGGSTISGGAGLQAASGAELVIRTNGGNDALTISTPILANGASSLTSSGAGVLTLAGANTYTGVTTINSTVNLTGSIATGLVNVAGGGTLNLSAGSVINPSNGNNGQFNVGSSPGGNAILNINGGTLNAGKNTNPSFVVGGAGGAQANQGSGTASHNASGFVKMTSGVLNTVHELHIGNGNGNAGANAYAAFTMSGGSVTSGNWLVVGLNHDRAILNQSGGSMTVSQNRMVIGAGGNASIGVVNQSGGALTVAAGGNTGIFLGENGFGNYTLSGTGELTLNTTGGATSGTMQFGGNATSLGANFNLNGGALTAFGVTQGASTAGAVYRFNFNGGTLRANASNTAFFNDLANTQAYIYAGGGTIDTAGHSITIAEPLRAPVGSGVSSIAVGSSGAGYVDQPVVTISGGSGTGATAIANVSGGVVTGFTITSPGSGYAPGDVLTVTLYGGGATTTAAVGAVTLGANSGGGLNKTGAGVLTIAGQNTYSGATNVTGGELRLAAASSLEGTSAITINGAGAKLVQNSFIPLTAPLTLTNGILDGTGVLSSVTVGAGTGGVITHGDGTGGPLTIDSLTFNGAATLNLAASTLTPALVTQSLITGATDPNGKVIINFINPPASWTMGDYLLISYDTLGGQGAGGFEKGDVPNLGARQAAAITASGGFVALTISGDVPVWTGAQSGAWTTNTVGGASNWRLLSSGAPTDFITGDTVVFDDSASGTTTVNISTANVSPTSTTFENSSLDYVITSSGGFGIASGNLVKSGSGSVTITTANSYAGGTTLNAGRLNLNNPAALGTGGLVINGGVIDNTSAAPITLSSNNPQTWNGDFGFGGTRDLNLGTGAITLTGNRTLTAEGAANLTVGGVISGAGFGFTKAGPGSVTLTAGNIYTGATDVAGGTLIVTGAINAPATANVGQINVGVGFESAVMRIVGGTVNATKTAAPSVVVGNSSFGGAGVISVDGGTLAAASELWVGAPSGASGELTLNAGSVSAGNWFAVGRDGAGAVNVHGGTLTVTGQNFVLGSFGSANGNANLTGGVTATTNTGANQGIFIVGEGGNGVLNISGDAALNVSGALGVQLARAASGTGTVNLNGGVITTPAVTRGAGASGVFNFNGGTLRPTASNAAFMTGLSAAYVFSGGAVIDTNNQNITIAQPLLVPTGQGVTSIGIENGGAGYVHAPLVRIFGGSGSGATGVASISNGVVTGITITNPGTGYEPGDFLFANLIGGGSTVQAIPGAINLAANNTAGGLNKTGAGALTLSGANTYAGPTNITGGTLVLDATGSINGSSGVSINGADAKLVQLNSATPLAPTVNVITGVLDGTGSLNAVMVGDGTGGVITNGNGGAGALTIGALTFTGPASVNVNTTGSPGILVTGALTTSGPGSVTLNVPVGLPWATGATYDLIRFGTLNGAIDHFVPGSIAGLGARQTPTPVIRDNHVAITISGDTPVWSGAASGAWTTAAVGDPFNWRLQLAGTGTEFIANDQVIFDDTAAGTTDVTITDGPVNPASVTFDNATRNYTISGASGIATGLLVKNGAGSVTISTANSYTGGTTVNGGALILSGNNNFGSGAFTVNGGALTLSGANAYTGATTLNAGTLNINNAAALGSTVLTINGGVINNSTGAAIVTASPIAQNWNGDFSFTGSGNLSFNNGPVTVGGPVGQRTVHVASGTLSTGIITAPDHGLTKTGPGALAMTNTANTSVIGGLLDVQAGALQIAGDLTVNGGLTGAGTIENGGAASKWLYLNNPNDTTFSGTIRDNPANAAVRLGLVKRGAGTLNLTGASNITTDRFAIENGAVRITGSYTTGFGTGASQVAEVGNIANQTGTLIVDGGVFNANKTNAPSLSAGTVATSSGVVRMTGGAINAANELWIGSAGNAYGALLMSGGTINTGSWLPVGRNGNGVAEISGGAINVNGANFTMGSFTGSNGVTNLTGGAINTLSTAPNEGGFLVAEAGNGTLNISGSGALNISGARGLHLAAGAGTGIANLNGGTVTTPLVQRGAGTGLLNFDGGALKASASSAGFMQGLTAAYVNDGGAILDDGGFNITVAQPLLAPTGGGVSSISFTGAGGYAAPPLVQINGDGLGASAVANIDANGNVTGVTITNPGVDYTFVNATLVTNSGGTSIFADAVNFADNVSGGLTKRGLGSVTLAGANTYTGATVIESGTLALALAGSISGSTAIQPKAGATFDVTAVGGGFSLAPGQTLTGSGSVAGRVAMLEGSSLAPGDDVGVLSFLSDLDLTLAVTPADSAALRFDLAGPGASDKVVFVTGGLAIGAGVLGFNDFAFTTLEGFANGAFTLFDGSMAINGTLDPNNLTGDLGNGFTGTLSFANGDTDILLTVIPEPCSAVLLWAGVGSLLGLRRFRRR